MVECLAHTAKKWTHTHTPTRHLRQGGKLYTKHSKEPIPGKLAQLISFQTTQLWLVCEGSFAGNRQHTIFQVHENT